VPPLTAAEAEVLAGPSLENSAAIVVAGEGWHPGIAGLIASRLKEKFRRPAFAIAFDTNAIGTGSGRSISDVDLGRVVRAAVDAGILAKGGGHCDGGRHHSRAGTARRFQGIPRSSTSPLRLLPCEVANPC